MLASLTVFTLCRRFLPQLISFYEKIIEIDSTYLEIVYVTFDSDQAAFDKYYEEMPWAAIPLTSKSAIEVSFVDLDQTCL